MKKISVIILVSFFPIYIFSQTITSTSAGGNWETAATWIGGIIPGESNNVIIDGTVSVTSSSSICNDITINSSGILQNGGSLGWVTFHVKGNLINNGTIRNNPDAYQLWIEVWKDVYNNGIWNNESTFFPAQYNQYISQAEGKYFDTEVRHGDGGGYTFDTGNLFASTDLTFSKKFNLQGYIANVGYNKGSLDMSGNSLTLTATGQIYNGTVKNAENITILDEARIYDLTFEGNTIIRGRGRIDNNNVTFNNNLTVMDTLQNGGNLGWVTLHVKGNLINNGVIRNNPAGYNFGIEVFKNVINNGVWINQSTYFPAQYNQYISQAEGKIFETEIRHADADGNTNDTGNLLASSDLTFTKRFNLQGYIDNVGYYKGSLDMAGNSLILSGTGQIYNGTVKNAEDLIILDDARIYDVTFDGNINIKGRGTIYNSFVTFNGNVTVIDTIQNGGSLGWVTPVINGDFINYGTVKNNDINYDLVLDVRGNIYNYGSWNIWQTFQKTEGTDRKISGTFNTIFYFSKTGEPQAGSINIDGKFTNENQINFEDGIDLIVSPGSFFLNEGTIRGNGNVINNSIFTSTHNLEWNDRLNTGLNAAIELTSRGSFENVEVTFNNNSFHPEMSSAIKQWWRIKGTGEAVGYKLTLTYDENLLNGHDENSLEVYLSSDDGKTWNKISNPINTIRDSENNKIFVGDNSNPLTGDFGDIIISSEKVANTPSISSAISGRNQIRVGPPNRYTISYWNNENFPTDKFCLLLETNMGVHIKSIFSKEISTGEIIEIPVDSLTYDGFHDEVILIVEPLAPKEVRSFDIILTAEPDLILKPSELITFTALALWVGGAVLEEYISNTIVEGCYEVWRPVEHDQSLKDASINCVKNSLNKAVTVENSAKGIAKKAAGEIIEKTGRVAVWPVMLAKDIFDCLGNTVKGMTDYVNGNFDKQKKDLTKVTSWDPNAKEGPSGFGENGYMAVSAPMFYTIFFENKKEATAPAYQVTIFDTLDTNVFDISTVQFLGMSHPMGTTSIDGNILKWDFIEIELPPNVTPPEGEGWVKFMVHPKANLETGTELRNRAVIKFDLNPWLATNDFINILDFDEPVTTPLSVIPLSGIQGASLSWNANDANGSGIKNSSIYISTNDGPYTLAAISDSNSAVIPIEWIADGRYKIYILSQDNVGNTEKNPVSILEVVTGIENENIIPEKFEIFQNYPNPFNPSTKINFSIPQTGFVELKIFNIIGEQIAILINEEKQAGYYSIDWNAGSFSSGVYIYKLTYNNQTFVKKMMLLK